jgi:hypothetical protein
MAPPGLDPVPVIDSPALDETADPDPECWRPSIPN